MRAQVGLIEDHWAASSRSTSICTELPHDRPCTGRARDAAQARAEVDRQQARGRGATATSREEAYDEFEARYSGRGPVREVPNPRIEPRTCRSPTGSRSSTPTSSTGVTSEVESLPRRRSLPRPARAPARTDLQHPRRAASGSRSDRALALVAAVLQVANTIRLAAFARRREIGIMRLVGASTLYIALPFLLEAVVDRRDRRGARRRGARGVHEVPGPGPSQHRPGFIPWVDMHDYWLSLLVMAILGPLLTLIPTLVLTRKYLKV